MKLALGTIPYYWPKEAVFDFYAQIQDAPVDVVYLGETVCAKRHALRLEDWLEIAEKLRAAGKAVFLSTQVLLESDTHLHIMKRIAENDRFPVEANDMGAVHLLADRQAFVAGMHLNVYHPAALDMMADMGATRWVMPLEMGKTDLVQMMALREQDIEVEVFGCGRMPLAFSARCFTARHYNLPKDDCHFRCMDHAEGLRLQTREQDDFLVLNGIQTQSDRIYCLIREMPVLQEMGVDVFRISPQWQHTPEVIGWHARVLAGEVSSLAAERALRKLLPAMPCNGYWHGQPGMMFVGQETV